VTGDNPVNRGPVRGKSPEDRLRERFVQGEISEEEYVRMKEVLRK
jgi:uncharacterized membrane protein